MGRPTSEDNTIQKLDHRFTPTPGVSYRLIHADNLLLAWETGPGFQAKSVTDR